MGILKRTWSRTQTFNGEAIVRILHFSYSYKAGSGFEISEAFKKLSKNIIVEKHHIPDG